MSPTYNGYVWIGPALMIVTPHTWELLEVIGACTVEVKYTTSTGIPSITRLAYNGHTSDIRCKKTATVVHITVSKPRGCLAVVTSIDEAIVKHWAPNKKLIYTHCDPTDTDVMALGEISKDNSIRCVTCGHVCGNDPSAGARLAVHLNIPHKGIHFITCHR
jgi:hypothetical protein